MTDNFLDTSLNTSKKNLICNHCLYDCVTIDHMKDHYKSDFHKYNLNRVTMNLNPLNIEEYTKKKELYQKMYDAKKSALPASSQPSEPLTSLSCDICRKSFSSQNKFREHMTSRSHKKSEEILKSNPVPIKKTISQEEEKTTKDDTTICLFCNLASTTIENNVIHMISKHKFDVPFIFCVKNMKGFLRLLGKKITTYVACLTCDCQNFKNYKSLQNHMMDKQHTSINNEDLEEFLYKFYDKNMLLSIRERELRKMKEFKILKIKLKMEMKKKLKEGGKKVKAEEEGWETVSEEENEKETEEKSEKQDESVEKTEKESEVKTEKTKKIIKKTDIEYESDDEFEPIPLPNGELLLENGTVVGNKLYQIYYKQRVHISKYDKMVDAKSIQKIKNIKHRILMRKRIPDIKKKYYTVRDSNKSSFARVNTLFKALKQVNV